jgi:uncharacterized protein (DUF1330 family)
MSTNAAILPDRQRFKSFLKGETPIGDGKFWLVNLLKFKNDGGVEAYRKYDEAIVPLMQAVGGKPIFRLFSHVRTVVNGGCMPEWDGIFIGEYPSPKAFLEFSSSDAYKAAHKHRADALEYTEMHAIKGFWSAKRRAEMGVRKPNLDMDMTIPTQLAEAKKKNPEAMRRINGDPEFFIKYFQDPQFDEGRIWMLNFLKFEEERDKRAYYIEYGARAFQHIGGKGGGMSEAAVKAGGVGGGVQMGCDAIWSLGVSGEKYDTFAVMQVGEGSARDMCVSIRYNCAVSPYASQHVATIPDSLLSLLSLLPLLSLLSLLPPCL